MDYQSLGKRVAFFREKSKLTQAQLAEMSSLDKSTISHIETAATKVGLSSLVRIVNALDVTLDELLYDSLEKTKAISIKEINELLLDCNDNQIKLLAQIMKDVKINIIKHTSI